MCMFVLGCLFLYFLFYRIALCTFSLATSYGAILLLPFSVIGNEIIHLHPDNYYIQWLTNSLVQGNLNLILLVQLVSYQKPSRELAADSVFSLTWVYDSID